MPHQCTSCGRTFADGSKQMLSGCPDCGGNKFQFMPAGAVDGEGGATHGAGGQRPVGGATPKKRPDDSRSGDAAAPETGGVRGVDPRSTDDRERDGRATDDRGTDDRGAVNRAAATVREWVRTGGNADESSEPATGEDAVRGTTSGDAVPDATREDVAPEDTAQASARRDVVSEDELPERSPEGPSSGGDARGRAASDTPASAGASTSTDASTSTREPESNESTAEVTRSEDDAGASTGDDAEVPAGANVVDAPDGDSPGLEELREELNSQFESIRIVNPGQYELNLMELYEREEYIISLQEDGKYVIEVPDAWDAVDR